MVNVLGKITLVNLTQLANNEADSHTKFLDVNDTVSKLVQFSNIPEHDSESTAIFNSINPVQFLKASTPIYTNPSGNEIDVTLVQFSNALFPILINPSGNEIDVTLVQFSNA